MKIFYSNHLDKTYDFDEVFAPNTDEHTIYKSSGLPLIDQLVDYNVNNCLISYGQSNLGKSKFMFKYDDCMFSEGLYTIFEKLGGLDRKTMQISDSQNIPKTHQIFLTCYQILNDEVTHESQWQECTTIAQGHKWRKANLEKFLKGEHGHFGATIKLRDVNKAKEGELTFIDVLPFDSKFTERIMGGQTDIELQSENENDYGKCITDI